MNLVRRKQGLIENQEENSLLKKEGCLRVLGDIIIT